MSILATCEEPARDEHEGDPVSQHLSFGLQVTQSTQLCHEKSATRPRAFQVRLFTTLAAALILSTSPTSARSARP